MRAEYDFTNAKPNSYSKKEFIMPTAEKTCVLTNLDESLMLSTEEYSDGEILAKLHSLPTVEYSKEFIRELDEIAEEAKADLAAGRIFPMTSDEFRAEVIRRRNAV